jgi:hypothetical protein
MPADAEVLTGRLDVAEFKATGLLDEVYYLQMNPDVAAAGEGAAEHFCQHGWQELRNPNRYFDLTWYQQQMPADQRGMVNPVLHYAREGERQGLKPAPFFDPAWYASRYGLSVDDSPLRHYLTNLHSGDFSPIAEFDAKFYLDRNPDVQAAGIDPFIHYLECGLQEGRDPAPSVGSRFYSERYLNGSSSKNPQMHDLQQSNTRNQIKSDPESNGVDPGCSNTAEDLAQYIGLVDDLVDTTIKGWSADKRHPTTRLEVQFEIGGRCIGRSVCNIYRPDLVRAGIGDGIYGFEFVIPYLAPGAEVRVKIAGTEHVLEQNKKLNMTGNTVSVSNALTGYDALAAVDTGSWSPKQREEALLTLMLHGKRLNDILPHIIFEKMDNETDNSLILMLLTHIALD